MYQTCLHCTASLGKNEVLETLPIGRQVAFDSNQGRLWVICSKCSKWNLVPFDDRLETIDACERLFRDTKTRYSTEHIGLAKLNEGLSLIRIGAPEGQEFASWRYGRAFQRRRLKAQMTAGGIAVPSALLFAWMRNPSSAHSLIWTGLMVGAGLLQGGQMGLRFAAHQRMKLKARDVSGYLVTLKAKSLQEAALISHGEVVHLEVRKPDHGAMLVSLTGNDADQMLGRILGKLNIMHGREKEVRDAVSEAALISTSGDEQQHLRDLIVKRHNPRNPGRVPVRLGDVLPERRLAYEMWTNEESERAYLSGQLQLLERQWREAEELAKLADGLALPEDSEALVAKMKTDLKAEPPA